MASHMMKRLYESNSVLAVGCTVRQMVIPLFVGIVVFASSGATKFLKISPTFNIAKVQGMSDAVDPRLRHGTVRELVPAEAAEKKPPEESKEEKGIHSTTDVATAKPTAVESYGMDMDIDDDRGSTEFIRASDDRSEGAFGSHSSKFVCPDNENCYTPHLDEEYLEHMVSNHRVSQMATQNWR